eukprot:1158985-Pelagomonas_calceolata.AAC.1
MDAGQLNFLVALFRFSQLRLSGHCAGACLGALVGCALAVVAVWCPYKGEFVGMVGVQGPLHVHVLCLTWCSGAHSSSSSSTTGTGRAAAAISSAGANRLSVGR